MTAQVTQVDFEAFSHANRARGALVCKVQRHDCFGQEWNWNMLSHTLREAV
jgi:hypothetical protein